MECKCDNVTYMLCMLSWTLLSGWQRSWSNVCALKSIKLKLMQVVVDIYWFLDVLDFDIWLWYWKLLNMGAIGTTFVGSPLSVVF
jgi:hypothetical protein